MENLNLIHDLAWKFFNKTNIEYEELFSEAALAYAEALDRFDSENGAKFTTFAYCHINNMLINFCKKQAKIDSRYERINDLLSTQSSDEDNPENLMDRFLYQHNQFYDEVMDFQERIENWSEDCKFVINLILKNPEPILKETPNFRCKYQATPKKRVRRLSKKLQRIGWENARIESVISNMEQAIQTL